MSEFFKDIVKAAAGELFGGGSKNQQQYQSPYRDRRVDLPKYGEMSTSPKLDQAEVDLKGVDPDAEIAKWMNIINSYGR